ncbi:MAG: DEAD/DEAH box helicase family protein, partial [Thermoplasmata archaeon]|nr:DEAD/DEAH box helicase family protein [Thermoplasmata archaeon]
LVNIVWISDQSTHHGKNKIHQSLSPIVFVSHEFIKPRTIEHRSYQVSIAQSALNQNTLIVLPTGMGKTVIVLLVIAEILKRGKGKILFLAPTKPLVIQHSKFLKRHLLIDEESIVSFSGEIPPAKRENLWKKGKIIVSTPQVIENDILSGRVDLSEVALVIFDEAHRAVGAYSYVFVAKKYREKNPDGLIIGMTASPGSEIDKIMEICRNLDIKNIEIRTKDDPDVKPYVQEMKIIWKKVELPHEFSRIINILKEAISERLRALKEAGAIESASVSKISRKKLLEIQEKVRRSIDEGRVSNVLFTIASLQNEALKIYHALELLQTQGSTALKRFFEKLQVEARSKGGSKASKVLMKDPLIMEAMAYVKDLKIEHPKIREIVNIVREEMEKNPDSRIIIFTNYRDTAIKVEEALRELPDVRPVRFIGQSSRGEEKGMSQKKQAEILEKFREGTYNVMIATSVAEEGIDIPSMDMVIFYEPIPSEIRTIQRRGRTGRRQAGKVVILMAKGTPDEGYYWSAVKKEKRMRRELEILRKKLKRKLKEENIIFLNSQKRLTDYMGNGGYEEDNEDHEKKETEGLSVVADTRECRTEVVRELADRGVKVIPTQIEVGDYVISDRICIERKSSRDFVDSMINGNLFKQIANLKNVYEVPILIVEGSDIFTSRNVNPSSIYGCLASIVVDYGVPILLSRSQRETANIIMAVAKREQFRMRKEIPLRSGKKPMNLKERQQYIVEGLPNISSVLAKRLLRHFKTIKNIANANEEELHLVDGIGKSIAKEIFQVFNEPYEEE